jgi:hypothetical protein
MGKQDQEKQTVDAVSLGFAFSVGLIVGRLGTFFVR